MEITLTRFLEIFKARIEFNVRTEVNKDGVRKEFAEPFYCTIKSEGFKSVELFDSHFQTGLTGDGKSIHDALDNLILNINKTSKRVGTSYDDSLDISNLINNVEL